MKNCCETLIKYILVLVNLLFLVFGLGLIGVGIYIQVEQNTYAEFLGEDNNIGAITPIFLTVVGGVISIIAFFGCLGACFENYCMIYTHAIFLTLIIIIQIAAIVVANSMKGNIEGELEKGMNDGMKNYNETGFDKVTEAWDFIQGNLECCGIVNATDWQNKGKVMPTSCLLPVTKDGVQDKLENFSIGCLTKVMNKFNENLTYVGGGGILIIFLQFIAVIFACCIGKSIKHSGEYV